MNAAEMKKYLKKRYEVAQAKNAEAWKEFKNCDFREKERCRAEYEMCDAVEFELKEILKDLGLL